MPQTKGRGCPICPSPKSTTDGHISTTSGEVHDAKSCRDCRWFCFCFSLRCRLKLVCSHDITRHRRQITRLARLQAAVHMTASDTAITDIDQLCHHLLPQSIRPGVRKSEVHCICLLMYWYRFLDEMQLVRQWLILRWRNIKVVG